MSHRSGPALNSLLVCSAGFGPACPCERQALDLLGLPFSPRAQSTDGRIRTGMSLRTAGSEPAGATNFPTSAKAESPGLRHDRLPPRGGIRSAIGANRRWAQLPDRSCRIPYGPARLPRGADGGSRTPKPSRAAEFGTAAVAWFHHVGASIRVSAVSGTRRGSRHGAAAPTTDAATVARNVVDHDHADSCFIADRVAARRPGRLTPAPQAFTVSGQLPATLMLTAAFKSAWIT